MPSGAALYLWNRQTGDLYLWENLAFTDNGYLTGSCATSRTGHSGLGVPGAWDAGIGTVGVTPIRPTLRRSR
ncbi:hypothetical protein Afe04nite_16690 [Asanoa ferruginea]|nr:hypothetical protein Afe04nite_16690 [Asanoa ferruginea]